MSVRSTLEQALKSVKTASNREETQRWLARTEILLDWIRKHPKLVEVNCEAAYLMSLYDAEPTPAPKPRRSRAKEKASN